MNPPSALRLPPLGALLIGGALLAGPIAAQAAPEPASAPKRAEPVSHEQALLQGLQLVEAGDFEGWIGAWCSVEKLCVSPVAIKSLKAYNLKSLQRLLQNPKTSCLKGAKKDSVTITRTDGSEKGGEVRVFIQCSPEGMPRPFHLEKEAKGWRFTRI